MLNSSGKVSVETFLGVIIQSSILTVGLLHPEFRPRDVMFTLDLIKNMIHHGLVGRSIEIQYVQIQRWLNRCVDMGWITAKSEGRITRYKIKVSGLQGLLQTIVSEDHLLETAEALLIQQILDAYGPHLEERVFGGLAPAKNETLRLLLKPGIVFQNQVKLLDKAIISLERRMKDSLRLQAFCADSLAQGMSTAEIVNALPSDFSYQLFHQKSFKELLQEIPAALADFEIRQGFVLRHRRFYKPHLRYLEGQKRFYEEILADI
ncbi:MAG: hypothetical protein NTX25_03745 [Proteobacteria bacterium]|nr:hypothetical protein [Pseudomonadota bacterium]